MTVTTFITAFTLRCLEPFILDLHHWTCSCSVAQTAADNLFISVRSFTLIFCSLQLQVKSKSAWLQFLENKLIRIVYNFENRPVAFLR